MLLHRAGRRRENARAAFWHDGHAAGRGLALSHRRTVHLRLSFAQVKGELPMHYREAPRKASIDWPPRFMKVYALRILPCVIVLTRDR